MPAKHLTEQDVVRIVKEEIGRLFEKAEEHLDVIFKPKGEGEAHNVISPQLRVKHKSSGLIFTVDQVGTNSVVVRSPDGREAAFSASDFENEFQLD